MDVPPISLNVALTISDPIKVVATFVVVYLYVDLSFKITMFVLRRRTGYDD